MNSGTTGGRFAAALPRTRVEIEAIATIGASMSTRVSFTTTAIARAAAPAVWAVATTCPTSCTLAPTQWPNCRCDRCSAPASSGSTTIARVP